MKRKRMLLCSALLILSLTVLSACNSANSDTAQTSSAASETVASTEAPETESETAENSSTDTIGMDFLDWVRENDRYKSVGAVSKEEGAMSGFIMDASGQPTTEDLNDILDFTSKAVASGGENDVFFVVVEDPDMQETIVGTSKGIYTGEGTVTVLVYSERLVSEENQVSADGTVYKYQVDRGYYDAGIATGYFNLAAIAHGYGTHMFQGTALSGGAVGERSANYDQFLKDEDGSWLVYRNGDTTSEQWYGDHPAENLKFVCAIVVGTMDTDINIDGFTGPTVRSEYPANYAYWSGYQETPEETDAVSSATTETEGTSSESETADTLSSATAETTAAGGN